MSKSWPAGVGRRVLADVDSTMAEAARLSQSLSAPEWILALQQTAAHGRRGRPWSSPKGNFAASFVTRPTGPVEQVALRSFVAATALRAALVNVGCPSDKISLKWPNDVLLEGRKLAGILLESVGDGRGGVRYLIVGIGVNLMQVPDPASLEDNALAPIALKDVGIEIAPETLLDALAPEFAERESSLTTFGFGPTRQEWLNHAARLNESITARLPTGDLVGTFRDIDPQGNLILETSRGTQSIAAADIYF